ncbi:hypothetical protein A2U01_0079242, partial [Trifolium medium]|nr:hypothetical protein [Trifolium medium]
MYGDATAAARGQREMVKSETDTRVVAVCSQVFPCCLLKL